MTKKIWALSMLIGFFAFSGCGGSQANTGELEATAPSSPLYAHGYIVGMGGDSWRASHRRLE